VLSSRQQGIHPTTCAFFACSDLHVAAIETEEVAAAMRNAQTADAPASRTGEEPPNGHGVYTNGGCGYNHNLR
jgi:hypothetical protein